MEAKVTEKNVYEKEVNGIKLRYSDEVVKSIRELTNEDVESLSRVSFCRVGSLYNKKSKTKRYILEVHLLPNVIVDNVALTLQEFNLICASNGIVVNPAQELQMTKIPCHLRFLHGIGSNLEEYRSVQLFPINKNELGLKRNSVCKSFFIDEKRIAEFLIYKLADKITFRQASSEEAEPLDIEEINY